MKRLEKHINIDLVKDLEFDKFKLYLSNICAQYNININEAFEVYGKHRQNTNSDTTDQYLCDASRDSTKKQRAIKRVSRKRTDIQ